MHDLATLASHPEALALGTSCVYVCVCYLYCAVCRLKECRAGYSALAGVSEVASVVGCTGWYSMPSPLTGSQGKGVRRL